MPEWYPGKYGTPGGHLIAARFDAYLQSRLIASPVDTFRGLRARLEYLLGSDAGAQALAARGVGKGGEQQFVHWMSGGVTPTREHQRQIDAAYREVRTANVARAMRARLHNGGRGTRITVEPVPPSAVPPSHRRRQAQLEDRRIDVRPATWDRLIDAWQVGDLDAMQAEWEDICDDLSSPPDLYFEVSHVGFGI